MMQNEKTITFDKLPEAVGYLTEQVIELKKMVSELKPPSSEKRVLIEIRGCLPYYPQGKSHDLYIGTERYIASLQERQEALLLRG